MKARAELDEVAESLRARAASGEALDPRTEALHLRRTGHSVVETMMILATGLDLPLADAKELMVRLAASGEDSFP